MRLAIGSDEKCSLTDAVVEYLKSLGHELDLLGPLAGEPLAWPDVAINVAQRISEGKCEQGILFCWTGTGVSIAANKVPGVRAALCTDAETARGARKWNDANVLCIGLRLISETVAREVLDAWFSAHPDPSEAANIQKVRELDLGKPGS
ncbi:MAG: RpiB/LacA/LacB family sugar-phosphate isomerase [Dehalococcoidia bacterium]|nr:RpiB/LacA/LacB family sugar-phosphate isomerase [Dehalococcoidia bacterium]